MIKDKENSPKYFWGNNCESFVLHDTERLSVKQESMPAGTREQLHFHNNAQQFFFILKGTATFFINDEIQVADEGQGISIAPKEQHYIENRTGENLEFLVISEPATNNDRMNIG